MRTIEMAILWDDHTWTDCHFVKIPEDTSGYDIEAAARDRIFPDDKYPEGFVMMTLYNADAQQEDIEMSNCDNID